MSLVTRVSVAFLVALALALGAFSACLYYVAGLRLRLALDQDLEATLDHFPEGSGGQSGRVTWAIYDETGRRVESTTGGGRPTVLDGRDLRPTRGGHRDDDHGARRPAMAGACAADRRRTPPSRAARGRRQRPSPRTAERDERKGAGPGRERPSRVLAAWASLEPVEAEIRSLAAILPLIALGLWAAGRGGRAPFRPACPRPARPHGRVGPHHALRRLPAAQPGDAATSWRNSPAASTGSSTACTWRSSGRGSSPARRRTSSEHRWPP